MDFYDKRQQKELEQQLADFKAQLEWEKRMAKASAELEKAESLYDLASKYKSLSEAEKKNQIDNLTAKYELQLKEAKMLFDIQERERNLERRQTELTHNERLAEKEFEIRNLKLETRLEKLLIEMGDWKRRALEAESGKSDPRRLIPGQLTDQIERLKEEYNGRAAAVNNKKREYEELLDHIDYQTGRLEKLNGTIEELRTTKRR